MKKNKLKKKKRKLWRFGGIERVGKGVYYEYMYVGVNSAGTLNQLIVS